MDFQHSSFDLQPFLQRSAFRLQRSTRPQAPSQQGQLGGVPIMALLAPFNQSRQFRGHWRRRPQLCAIAQRFRAARQAPADAGQGALSGGSQTRSSG